MMETREQQELERIEQNNPYFIDFLKELEGCDAVYDITDARTNPHTIHRDRQIRQSLESRITLTLSRATSELDYAYLMSRERREVWATMVLRKVIPLYNLLRSRYIDVFSTTAIVTTFISKYGNYGLTPSEFGFTYNNDALTKCKEIYALLSQSVPHPTLDELLEAWGLDGSREFLKMLPSMEYHGLPDDAASFDDITIRLSPEEKIAGSLVQIDYYSARCFVMKHLPQLLTTNREGMTVTIGSSDYATNIVLPASILKNIAEQYARIQQETANDPDGIRATIATSNLIYVPVNKLLGRSLFDATVGEYNAFMRIVEMLNIRPEELRTQLRHLIEAGADDLFEDPYVVAMMQDYPSFAEHQKKQFLELLYRGYKEPDQKEPWKRTVAIYTSVKKGWGSCKDIKAGSTLYFGRSLPAHDDNNYRAFVIKALEEVSTVRFRREVLSAILAKDLHPFFEDALDVVRAKRSYAPRVADFLDCDELKLNQYHAALKNARRENNTIDERFFELYIPEPESLFDHYDRFSAALLAAESVLSCGKSFVSITIETQRRNGVQRGMRERIQREIDAILSCFDAVAALYTLPAIGEIRKDETLLRKNIAATVRDWHSKQGGVIASDIEEALHHFNYDSFFISDAEGRQYAQRTRHDVAQNTRLVFERLLNPKFYREHNVDDALTNALSRLRMGQETHLDFDELRIENNKHRLDDFFNNAAECTANGSKYPHYGYAHMHDSHIGIIAANLYRAGKFLSTFGKAYLALACDEKEKPLLYVDGVVMLQDIADMVRKAEREPDWMPMYTKAMIMTAMAHELEEILFNVSHKLAQRSVWQYIDHVARLLCYKEGDDYTYREGRVHPKAELKTMSDSGFQLNDNSAAQNYHSIEKVPDPNYDGEHLLEGFWINHWDPKQAADDAKASAIPGFVQPVDHREQPMIHNCKGHIIGFRRKTSELIEQFNAQYGAVYGSIVV